MKKSEMAAHSEAYRSLMRAAKEAERRGLYRAAVDAAVAAWEHIDGMMQYGMKYEDDDFVSISAIDAVLKHAPLLFDFRNLDALEQLLETRKRIEKNTSQSVVEKLSKAREQIWVNHRLWGYLERYGEVRQDQLSDILGGGQEYWRSLSKSWAAMGLVTRVQEGVSYRIALSTRMGQVVRAKCSSCGKASEAPKGMFLEKMKCPYCNTRVLFVLLSSDGQADSNE